MTWVKVDDQLHSHPKVRKAWRNCRPALGLHLLALSYCGAHLTDGVVYREFVEDQLPGERERMKVTSALVDAGLWLEHPEGFLIADWLDYNPSKAAVERNREWDRQRKELSRDPVLTKAIKDRDQDRCRYCGTLVNWFDRRSESGGTYDHVTPRGPNTLANVVVACRRCSFSKGARTPTEAGLVLLAPGQIGPSPDLAGSSPRFSPRSTGFLDNPTRPDPTRPDPTPLSLVVVGANACGRERGVRA